MKNQETNDEKYPRLGNLELMKTLNYGVTCKVKLGRDRTTKKEYAVKILKTEFQERYLSTVEQEAKFHALLTEQGHKNIIKLVDYYPKADYIKKNGKVKKVFALVLELAEGGDLFECLRALEKLREDIARTYFHQLIDTIEFLHEKGVIHRDIKPDNLLLGADFTLQIADFSFATYALTENDSPLQREIFGTVNYMAPELLANNKYIGQFVDVFSCGVILFLMVVGQPPFDKASEQDVRYRLIMKHQFTTLWKQYERGGRTFSNDFKSLINAMLAYDPAERLTLPEIKSEPWYLGKTCSQEELKEEYEKKKLDFLRYQEEKARETQKIKEDRAAMKKKVETNLTQPKLNYFHMMKGITPLKHRSISEALDKEVKGRLNADGLNPNRCTREYVFTGYRGLTEAFYSVSQETMFNLLFLLSTKLFNHRKIHDDEFKVKGRVVSDNNEFTGEIAVSVAKIDDFSCCLSFTRIKGPLVSFYKLIEETIKPEIDNALSQIVSTVSE